MANNGLEYEYQQQLIKGSKTAFNKLFQLYFPRLKKYAITFLKNSQESEDLVQDVFIQVWNNRDTISPTQSIGAFLFVLVKNRCLNVLKKRVVEEKYQVQQSHFAAEELYHIGFEIDDDFSSMEERLTAEIEKIILKMPSRCQDAFRLKWIEGKKIREIAEIMDISTTMVDKHLAKGLQIARENLSPNLFLFLITSQVKE